MTTAPLFASDPADVRTAVREGRTLFVDMPYDKALELYFNELQELQAKGLIEVIH